MIKRTESQARLVRARSGVGGIDVGSPDDSKCLSVLFEQGHLSAQPHANSEGPLLIAVIERQVIRFPKLGLDHSAT